MTKEYFEKISIIGVRVDLISLEELVDYVLLKVFEKKKTIIANVNVNAINIAYELQWFKDFINSSDIVICDGFGVKWAGNFLTGKKLQRYTHVHWFDSLAEACSVREISMFFLGARQEVVEKAAMVLKKRIPNLNIVGVQHGYFNKAPLSFENQEVLNKINKLRPDILVLGFGMPMQEKWIRENLGNLQTKVVIPSGGFFDYLAGEVVRAPKWMTDNGLEWLGRLLIEPRRLWKRYILGNPLFIWRVILQKLNHRN